MQYCLGFFGDAAATGCLSAARVRLRNAAAGVGVGYLFALLVLLVSVVSVPLLLNGDVGLGAAISTSARGDP